MLFSGKNKKLLLSTAINVILAFALSMLVYLVYPQFVYELDSVSNWDRYSIRTYRNYEKGVAYFEVLVGPKEHLRQPKVPRRIYSCSGGQAFFVELFGADITGNGMPNLVIRQWNGSAHGDSRYLVLEMRDSVVSEVDVIDGLFDVKFQDLNNDGIAEVTGTDKAYSYFGGDCFAGSPRPSVVLSFDKAEARFVPDKQIMSKPPLSRDQLDKLSLKYKHDPMWSEESHPPSELFAAVLELIYRGNEKQAWELFDVSWPDVSETPKEQCRESLESDLRKSLFYPVVAGWNNQRL